MPKRITKGNLWGFIQSRPYASVSDIRRLFLMDVEGAARLATGEGTFYIGLPQEAADLVRQLWNEGRIVLDVNPDVKVRVVQGIYPAHAGTGRRGGVPLAPAMAPPSPPEPAAPAAPAGADESAGSGFAAGKKRRRRRRKRAGSGEDESAET